MKNKETYDTSLNGLFLSAAIPLLVGIVVFALCFFVAWKWWMATTPLRTIPGCTPNWNYANVVNKGTSWVVISTQGETNQTGTPIRETFTATSSQTVTVSDAKKAVYEFKTSLMDSIMLPVQKEIDTTVSEAVSTEVGSTATLSIPAGQSGFANYGVRVRVVSGHLYDSSGCEGSLSDYGTDTAYVPMYAGWCVWLSSQPACPKVA